MSGFTSDTTGFYIVSDPADVRDYQIDWGNILDPGETIVASTWAVPVGLTAGIEFLSLEITGKRISGGRVNTTHLISNTITTSLGRVYKRGFQLRIKTGL